MAKIVLIATAENTATFVETFQIVARFLTF